MAAFAEITQRPGTCQSWRKSVPASVRCVAQMANLPAARAIRRGVDDAGNEVDCVYFGQCMQLDANTVELNNRERWNGKDGSWFATGNACEFRECL